MNTEKKERKPGSGAKTKFHFTRKNTDWRKPNFVIAKEMGCTAPTVHYARKKLGLPRAYLCWGMKS